MKTTVRDFGPTELYIPKIENHLVDIVFVHGLFGHAKNTWTQRTSHELNANQNKANCNPPPSKKARVEGKELFHEAFWPQDLLPNDFPNARIITWGYDVAMDSLFSDTSKASIFQHAETLLTDLVSVRVTDAAKKIPLIFVVHSLGGIIVKDALSLSKMETTFFREIFPPTAGVVFLGTPHRGSKAATLGKIAFEMSRAFLKDPNIKILRALEKNSEILERISRSFGSVLASGQIKVHSFQEELKTKGMEIVDSSSSTIGYLHESRSSLHANHRSMTKFSSADDINFKRVSSVLCRWIDDIDRSQVTPNISMSGLSTTAIPDSVIYDEAYRQCLEALLIDRARVRLQNVEPAYPDTYNWLYDGKLGFRDWLEGKTESDIFWVSGKPGSGKSTLMKHAMTHKNTLDALQSYSGLPWLLTGYFFHDRGTAEQKTVDGFLREILYQMLRQRQGLFALIQEIHEQPEKAPIKVLRQWWNVERLRQALLDIGTGIKVPLNCCLFVDALDEHDGNHRDLISTLRTLSCMPKGTAFRLRLCVAGRPENVFKDAFNTLPGFAIHEYTVHDVRHYAEDRIRKEQLAVLGDQGRSVAHRVVDQIVRRANGVFLWVRLVVDELIEGLCEGDTAAELELLLSEIPDELSDLYRRAICRVKRTPARTSARSVKRHKYETYVMFQMVLSLIGPIPLKEIINASIFLAGQTTTKWSGDPRESMDHDQMQRRLNSRSAGLLETTSRSCDGDVQFIHQTVKEFVRSKKGRDMLRETVPLEKHEDGLLLTFRYIIKQLEFGSRWSMSNFQIYAQALERKDGPAAKWIEPTAEILCAQPEILQVVANESDPVCFNTVMDWLGSATFVHEHPAAYLMLFYICCNLPLSVNWYLKRRREEIDTETAGILFEAALHQDSRVTNGRNDYPCFQSLLKAGIGVDMPQHRFDWLNERLEELQKRPSSEVRPGPETLVLWEQCVAARKSRARDMDNEHLD